MAEGTRELWASSGRLPEGIIYPDLIHSGFSETLVQNTEAFNAASGNTIRQLTARHLGDFAQESFFKNVANLINRRDVNASPANPGVTSSQVPMDEMISVKLNRRIGPIDQTLDSFKKIGNSARLEELSFLLGGQIAKAASIDWLDSGLTAAVGALENQAAVLTDISEGSPSLLNTSTLIDGLAKFGDAASNIKMWVMHSKAYYNLVQQQINLNIDGLSNFNVATATPVTMNRPVLVTDAAALQVQNGTSPDFTEYYTLGLTEDAVVLEDSEDDNLLSDLITGKENIVVRLQGEFAYNCKVKGFKWDTANGGVNPDAAALGTGTNWDAVMDSHKDFAGILLRTR